MSARSATGGRVASLVRGVLLLGVAAAAQPPACGAEVWPRPPSSVHRGPLAVVEGGPLALWNNPALLAQGEGWSAGAGRHVPFGVAALARSDLSWARRGATGAAVGHANFGSGEHGTSARALGLARRLGGSRASAGLTLRHHARDRASAWAADVGLALRPAESIALGVAARSALRAGRLEVAPESEWELAVRWRRGGFAASAGLSRDAVGPLARSAGLHLGAEPLALHLLWSARPGGENRVAVAVAFAAGGLRLGAARESGAVLPSGEAVIAGWHPDAAGASARSAGFMHGIPPLWLPAPREGVSAGATDPGEDAERELEAAADADPELADELVSGGWRASEASRPGWPGRFRLRFGQEGGRRAGLGLTSALELPVVRIGGARLAGGFAVSRDPGEPAGLDEGRASLDLRASRFRLVAGDLDLAAGLGLALAAPGLGARVAASRPALVRLSPAARAGRVAVPAHRGLAFELWPSGELDLRLAHAGIARDASHRGSGLWTTGGRRHVSGRERERRGALGERLWLAAIAATVPETRLRLSAVAVDARYRGAAPRLLTGGAAIRAGRWFALAAAHEGEVGRGVLEWAIGPGGRMARGVEIRWSARPAGRRLSASFAARDRAAGYAAATALPGRAEEASVRAHLRLARAGRRPGAWLAIEALRWWTPEGVTVPSRRTWSRTIRFGTEVAAGESGIRLEASRQRSWRFPAPRTSAEAGVERFPAVVRLGATWDWSPRASPYAFRLAGRLRTRAGVRGERWEGRISRRWDDGADLALTIWMTPGRDAASFDLISDPLGGLRLLSSPSPSRLRLRLRLPLAKARGAASARGRTALDALRPRRLALEGRWRVSSRGPRLEFWCSLEGGAARSRPRHPEGEDE